MGRANRLLNTTITHKARDLNHLAELEKYGLPTTNKGRVILRNRLVECGLFAVDGFGIALAVADILTGEREPEKLGWQVDPVTGVQITNDRAFVFRRNSGDYSWLGFKETFPRIAAARKISQNNYSFAEILHAPSPLQYAESSIGGLLIAQTVALALERGKIPEAYPDPTKTVVLTAESGSTT